MIGNTVRLLACALLAAAPLHAQTLQDHLRTQGTPPVEYLLSKIADHRIVIVGEAHWQRKDAELIAAIVPALARRNVALATELLAAESQAEIDSLIAAPEWNPARANAIMRAASWPYAQYRDILQAAWNAARTGGRPLTIIALAPGADFREKGIRYDPFMAERVLRYATDDGHRVLVQCGMHHAFTRFLQVERRQNGRATEFMDRMGNILWRAFGENVFLVALHKPEPCGGWDAPSAALCAPLRGAIDCAAIQAGGRPVGFDVLGSPVAETRLDERSFYALSHPLLRLIDYTDGYIWQVPVDDAPMVDLIPLAEYSPTDAADEAKRAEWLTREVDHANPKTRPNWAMLPEWRARCAPAESPKAAGPFDLVIHPVTGRRIAPVMTHQGAGWLDRPEREAEEAPERALDAIGIAAGSTVADVGAGSGYFTVRLARRVGKPGRVFATDIQPEMLTLLRERLAREDVTNVTPVLGTADDPRLAPASVDLVLMVDVYHELSRPQQVLRRLREALRPGGRLVLIEYRKEDPTIPIRYEHRMSVDEARRELEAEHYRLDRVIDVLPRQHILVFK